jgi:hypothetical protein
MNRRDNLAKLMEEASTEQNAMLLEADEFFKGDVHKQYIEHITAMYDRTVPGTPFEQVFSALIKIADNTATLAANNAEIIRKNAETAETETDKAA